MWALKGNCNCNIWEASRYNIRLVQYLHLILFGRGRQKKRGLKVEHRQSTGFLLIVSILPTCEKAWHINAFLGIFILWTGTSCITWVLWCFIDFVFGPYYFFFETFLVHIVVVSFYKLCTISLYRTDSALKFGWFFVSYMASLYIFSLCSLILHLFCEMLISFLLFLQAVAHCFLHFRCSCPTNYLQRKISHVSSF